MAARFHINSIDLEKLKAAGYSDVLVRGGEVVRIVSEVGAPAMCRMVPQFEHILTECMIHPDRHPDNIDNSGMSEG